MDGREPKGLQAQGLRYESDQTDAEWALVKPIITTGNYARPIWAARLRTVLDAILYVLTTGCTWRQLPKDFPPRSTVHDWVVRWHCDRVLERVHLALYQQVRELEGRRAVPALRSWTARAARAPKKGEAHRPDRL